MPKGGKRPGAGKPKGYKHARTLEKEALDRLFNARVAAEFTPLLDSLFEAAKGVQHMMARGKDGKWAEVTDPAAMRRCLDSGESFYRLSARNPDVKALKDIFDRRLGAPKQTTDLNVKKAPAEMSEEELDAHLEALAKKRKK